MLVRFLATSCVAFTLSCPVFGGEFASTVVHVNLGPGANPSFPPSKLLGGPQGGGLFSGGLDVCSLGAGGSVTLGFNVVLKDGPGADFIAFENGFQLGGAGIFSEVALVEVSTDGVTFARFPTRYVGPPALQPPFGTLPIGTFAGLVGGMPCLANVLSNSVPPDDPVRAGGDAFDLADLAQDPAVLSGAVDPANIHFVRLVDVVEGTVLDSASSLIYDNGGAGASADLDAVAVINHQGNVDAHQPRCDLAIDAQGFLVIELGDPDGFYTLNLAELRASFNTAEFPFFSILPAFQIVSFDGAVAELRSIGPLVGSGVLGAFAVSVKDQAGGFSGDQVMLQG